MRDYSRKYRAENQEKVRAAWAQSNAARRAKVDSGVGLGTTLGWLSEQPKVCFYCGADCANNFHVDHFMPLARGGAHVLTNLRIACAPCNLSKSASDPLEWIDRVSAAMFAQEAA